MLTLQSISNLPSEAADLLEAIGYLDAHEFCESSNNQLLEELLKANETLKIISEPLKLAVLSEWKTIVLSAMGEMPAEPHKISKEEEAETIITQEVELKSQTLASLAGASCANFEESPRIQAMLKEAPVAELLPVGLIKQHQIAVGDIEKGILLTECEGDVALKEPSSSSSQKTEPVLPVKKSEPWPQKPRDPIPERKRSDLMTSRIRDFSAAENEDHHVKPLDRGESREVVSLSKGLNQGLTPKDRRFVRGVLHPDPWRVRSSAFFAVLAQIFLVASFVVVPSLILYDYLYDVPDVLWGIVGVVIALVVSGICYLLWGLRARCRVCGQRQFAPKMCLKHRKAHHIPLIGYIFPTALHAMFYKWFYCTYCGTAVRLKK